MVIDYKNVAAALALGVVLAAAGSPALAQKRPHATHPGHAARAQALPDQDVSGEGSTMTPARERALRECTEQANKLVQKDWGVMQNTTMGSCMNSHGQMQ